MQLTFDAEGSGDPKLSSDRRHLQDKTCRPLPCEQFGHQASMEAALDMKVPSPFVPQISIASTCVGDAPVLRSISDGSCSTSDADGPGQQQRLWLRAMDSQWKLSRKDLKMKVELSRTLKSTLYQATWQGEDVVVKCAGLHDDVMAKAIRRRTQPTQPLESLESLEAP
jgi:hypothetical protein